MNALKTIWHDILLVWTFFTRIPAPHFMTERKLSQALWALPLVGLLLAGLQWTAIVILGEMSLPTATWENLAALTLLALPILLTGGLHWDGLGDIADGLGVGKDRRPEVMRDPNVGAFAVLGLILFALAQFLLYKALLALPGGAFSLSWLIFIALLSRQAMGLLWAWIPAADAKSQAKNLGRPNLWGQGALLLGTCLAAWFYETLSLPALVAFLAFIPLWGLVLRRWLSGINGDGLGATQVVCETLLLFLILVSHV